MANALRFAIAGPGYIGSVHARAIAATEGAELVAVLGSDGGRAGAFAAEHAGLRCHGDVAELAADAEVDCVVLATPNHLHAPQALVLLEAGKHLLIEKPLAMNVGEGLQIVSAAEREGRCVAVGHMWRFDREAQHLRAAVERGDLGEIVKTKGYGIHVNWGPSGWFTSAASAGGGALIDMGIHAIDTVRYLLGDPEPRSVYARLSTRFGEYDVDDLGLVVIEWDGGTVSSIESGWWNPHMDGPEASTQLFGTRGYARLFPTSIERTVGGESINEVLDFPPRKEHCDPHIYAGQIAAFVRCVRENRKPAAGLAEGISALRICEAAVLSSRENRVVELRGPLHVVR